METSRRTVQVVVTIAATATLAAILFHVRQPALRSEPETRAEITKQRGLNIGVGTCGDSQPAKVQPAVNEAGSCSADEPIDAVDSAHAGARFVPVNDQMIVPVNHKLSPAHAELEAPREIMTIEPETF